jgi:DNA (cytosine-5)-methyltransferase 1
MQPTLGSLFAGIGGIDLGFERAGFKTSWQVEIDPYCQRVLERHFPDAERFNDVRTVGVGELARVDGIAAGFPCQDISNAGLKAGIRGARSGLWSECARIVGVLRPRFVLLENVAALLGRGIGEVLGDLAEIGYDAEWQIISAADVGAPHIRERVWILAYPGCEGVRERGRDCGTGSEVRVIRGDGLDGIPGQPQIQGQILADANILAAVRAAITRKECRPWPSESGLARVAHGIPARVDRIRCCGNAVVPQIPEMIAKEVIKYL